jgi:plasmid stabilization system protein ParE
MSLSITFHRAANAEFIEASSWYEEKRMGLGTEFITEVESCLEVISENPLRYLCVHQNIRRIAVSKFPYSVYFRVEEYRIVVLAVFHSRRNPAIWKGRV